MLRSVVCSLVALALFAGVSTAAQKEKPKAVSGTFVSFKDGTLTILVAGKKGDEAKPQEFKLTPETKVALLDGDTKKEISVKDKDAFKDLKEKTPVTVTLGEGDKVIAVQVGSPKKKTK